MAFRLQVRNYRGLRAVDWSPEGVCALVGANGSGKTTLLDVPALLGDALDRGLARALEDHGGIANARNMYAGEREPYDFEITVGQTTWRLAPVLVGDGFRSEEQLVSGGHVIVSRAAGADSARVFDKDVLVRNDLALRHSLEIVFPEPDALPEVLSRYRLYGSYDLAALRRSGSPDSSERRLDRRGTNVFSVLRNWRDKKPDRMRYDFVLEGLREIFADFFDDLEFEKPRR
jgi:hypothetical protein